MKDIKYNNEDLLTGVLAGKYTLDEIESLVDNNLISREDYQYIEDQVTEYDGHKDNILTKRRRKEKNMAERKMHPSNSSLNRQETKKERPNLDSLVQGRIKRKKPGMGKKLSTALLGEEDTRSIGGYLVQDVVIPAVKYGIVDIVQEGIARLFGVEGGRRDRKKRDRDQKISYNSIKDKGRSYSSRSRNSHSFDDIAFEDRAEAEDVLDAMLNILDEYDSVSVAEFYRLAGVNPDFQDEKWGWDSLRTASIKRLSRDEFVIALPRAKSLD